MEKQTLLEYIDWVVDRVNYHANNDDYDSAVSLLDEFDEWLCPSMVGEIFNS